MPVTARLSKKFYETFGDEIANELVNWFNQVDTTYRSEFKDLFEVHFSKFDAKLEQRTGELRAELRGEMEQGFARLEAKLEQRTAELRAEFREAIAGLQADAHGGLHAAEVRLIRWMFVFWIGSLGTTVALIKL